MWRVCERAGLQGALTARIYALSVLFPGVFLFTWYPPSFSFFFKLPLLLSLLHTFNLQDEIGLDYDLDHAHAVFTAAAMDDYLLKEGFVRSDWPHRYRRHVR